MTPLEDQLAEALRNLIHGMEEQRKRNSNPSPYSIYVRMKIKEAESAIAEFDRQQAQENNRVHY
jgi:hypothetical protein